MIDFRHGFGHLTGVGVFGGAQGLHFLTCRAMVTQVSLFTIPPAWIQRILEGDEHGVAYLNKWAVRLARLHTYASD